MAEMMPDWLQHQARTHPEHPALRCDGQTVTFAELARRVAITSARLHRLGVRSGDRVAVLVGSRPEFVEILHGLAWLGAVLVPVSTRLSASEVCQQLADCEARLLIHDRTTATTVAAVWESPAHQTIDLDGAAFGDIAVDTCVEPAPISLRRVHSIIYTSGSTGRPKGVLLTFGNHLWSAVGSAFNLGVQADDRWLACLPLCHVGGLAILLRSVIYGMTVVLQSGFDPRWVNRAIDEERVTIVSVVANMLQRMFDARGERPYPPWLRCVLLGGGPAPPALLDACVARGVPVVQTYGLTEAASQVTTLAPRDAARKRGSAGKPLLTTEVCLSASDGAPATGEVGEILVRGPTMSVGYVGQHGPHTDADGWWHTGDLGRFDEEGFLYVVGRRNELIISGGENIYPTEVEAALRVHPDVVEAYVFGVPDERWGQAVAACVQLRPGATLSARDLQDHTRRWLAGFKVPRHIRFVADYPRTAAGKILRHRVRADATATWQHITARK